MRELLIIVRLVVSPLPISAFFVVANVFYMLRVAVPMRVTRRGRRRGISETYLTLHDLFRNWWDRPPQSLAHFPSLMFFAIPCIRRR